MPRATRLLGASDEMSSPSKNTRPRDGLMSPIATRSSVVLPAPLWPSTATTFPVGTVTPCSTRVRP